MNKLIDVDSKHIAGTGATTKLFFSAGAGVKDIHLTRAEAAKVAAVLVEWIASELSE